MVIFKMAQNEAVTPFLSLVIFNWPEVVASTSYQRIPDFLLHARSLPLKLRPTPNLNTKAGSLIWRDSCFGSNSPLPCPPWRGSRRSVFLAHTQRTNETRAATHPRTPGAATHKHAPTQHRLWPATRAHMSITRHMDNMVGLVRCGAFRARPVANAQRTGALRPPPVIANATTALRESNVPIRPVCPRQFSLSLASRLPSSSVSQGGMPGAALLGARLACSALRLRRLYLELS